MFVYSAACHPSLSLISLSDNASCLLFYQSLNSLVSESLFLWSSSFLERRMLPGHVWLMFLLLLCLSQYVLWLLELNCCTVCLLTACSCKVSHVFDCFLILLLSFVQCEMFHVLYLHQQRRYKVQIFPCTIKSCWQLHFDWLHHITDICICIIREAIQGLIYFDDVTSKHKNRAD